MPDDNRDYRICTLVSEYVRSPSLRHLRDLHPLHRLAGDIVKEVASPNPIWTKWSRDCETVARPAACCSIPPEEEPVHKSARVRPRGRYLSSCFQITLPVRGGCMLAREPRIWKPMAAKPRSIMAHVAGSGRAGAPLPIFA